MPYYAGTLKMFKDLRDHTEACEGKESKDPLQDLNVGCFWARNRR